MQLKNFKSSSLALLRVFCWLEAGLMILLVTEKFF